MEDKDASQEALEQVEAITESGPVSGEDLLGSEELKRKLREDTRTAAVRGGTKHNSQSEATPQSQQSRLELGLRLSD